MSTNRTKNYELCQWEPEDAVRRTDFNDDNRKIDEAIKAVADQADGLAASKADAAVVAAMQGTLSSLQTAVEGKQNASGAVKFAAGHYTGNGNTSQTISLSFTPKAVLVFPESGGLCSISGSVYVYGGLAVTGSPAKRKAATAVEIISSGFKVYTDISSSTYTYVHVNDNGDNYNYIALG